MHLTEGEIRAYQDQALDAGAHRRAAAHLADCAHCRQAAQASQERTRQVQEQLASLEIRQVNAPAPADLKIARRRLAAHLEATDKRNNTMWNKITSRRARPAWAALALVAILAIALSFPSVRVAAGSFLGLFRIEQIRVVQTDPEALSEKLQSSSQLEALMSDSMQFEPEGEALDAADAAQASALAGFAVRMPADMEKSKLIVQPGGSATMTVDLELVRGVLKDLERTDIELPDALDGAQIEITVPSGVSAAFGECEFLKNETDPDAVQIASVTRDCTLMLQMPSPTISAPPGLNLEQIGEAYLQVLGMDPEEAASFARNVDWTTTFVIPIPRYGVEYQEIAVDGVTGVLIENYDAMLLWVKDGVIYSINGANKNRVLNLADQLP
jgi:hypothetical protein